MSDTEQKPEVIQAHLDGQEEPVTDSHDIGVNVNKQEAENEAREQAAIDASNKKYSVSDKEIKQAGKQSVETLAPGTAATESGNSGFKASLEHAAEAQEKSHSTAI